MPLPEAVERRKNELPPFYVHLITAGIRTGRLPDVLSTLTAYSRTVATTKSIVIEAAVLPDRGDGACADFVRRLGVFCFAAIRANLPRFPHVAPVDHGSRAENRPTTDHRYHGPGRFDCRIPADLGFVADVAAWAICAGPDRLNSVSSAIGMLIRSARLAAFADLLAVLVEYEMPLPEAFRLAARRRATRSWPAGPR